MPITRVFRVRIDPTRRAEFEQSFAEISVQAVIQAPGSLSVAVFRPTEWAPDEFAMISKWQDEAALRAFAGDDWNQAVIPSGMEALVRECWVHHYQSWD